jgi:hypothetical protein
MIFQIPQGVQISLDNVTWYKLTDHNRQPIDISYNLIESTDRMADGTLRKFIIAKKFVISADWVDLPTLDSNLVDYSASEGVYGAKGGAWIKAFYEANAFQPVYVKLIFAQDTIPTVDPKIPDATTYVDADSSPGQVYNAFMTTFTYNIKKRRAGAVNLGYDYVDLKIEFTEI